MTNTSLRIHPAIGIARVGNSPDYYLGPETMAAIPQEGTDITGGLPIKKGTDSTTITSDDLRDIDGCLKRQAARFKIYQYPNETGLNTYPTPGGQEVLINSIVDGKKVVDIIWTAHLANKKANAWIDTGEAGYVKDAPPKSSTTIRNSKFMNGVTEPSNENRLKNLVIDAGPRTIKATLGKTAVKFDYHTEASYYDKVTNKIIPLSQYPVQFPASKGEGSSYNLSSVPISYLGEMLTEPNGRLLVLGGHGKACAFNNQGEASSGEDLCHYVDNDNWLDDTSDGPVTAVLLFEDGSKFSILGSAWVVATDPAYAPQTLNAVSLWDDVYNTWLEDFKLQPEVYNNTTKKYNEDYKPYFKDDVLPTLIAAHMQMWNTNLPDQALSAHKMVVQLPEDHPGMNLMPFIRNPNLFGTPEDESQKEGLMPLSLGDQQKSFLSVSKQQYFFLEQWHAGKCQGASKMKLGAGEKLDKTILVNCLGGRFSPGIDLTWIVRDTNLYNSDWQNPHIGPFRINKETLDYASASKEKPFLGVGYVPLNSNPIQPGDLCKFMAIPWHTDYNSCATHTPAPNPGGKINLNGDNIFSGVNTTLFWSWPAQRPVAVYTFDDLVANSGKLPDQRYSVRGHGTNVDYVAKEPPCEGGFDSKAMNVGRFQNMRDMLTEWVNIGTIMQGPAIKGYPEDFDKDLYLETQSKFDKDESNEVLQWPNNVNQIPPEPKN